MSEASTYLSCSQTWIHVISLTLGKHQRSQLSSYLLPTCLFPVHQGRGRYSVWCRYLASSLLLRSRLPERRLDHWQDSLLATIPGSGRPLISRGLSPNLQSRSRHRSSMVLGKPSGIRLRCRWQQPGAHDRHPGLLQATGLVKCYRASSV